MPTSLSWDDLRFFLAVRQRGSIGGAARWLGVNHSTVLRRIGSLEAALGQRLFERLPTGYVPTAEGDVLMDRLAVVSERIESVQRHLDGGIGDLRGTVRITTTETLAHGILMPHFARFRDSYPEIDLQLVINEAFLNLTMREADIAIRGTNDPPGNLVGRNVGVMQTALYASRGYLDRMGPDATDADRTWVGPDESLRNAASWTWLQDNVPPERIGMRVDSFVGIANAVSAGIGIGLVLCPIAEQRPDLVRLGGPYPELDTHVWVLIHPDLKQTRRVRLLIDHMVESLRCDSRLLPV
jgi:DNA-binding transcriptional LysR family regulator